MMARDRLAKKNAFMFLISVFVLLLVLIAVVYYLYQYMHLSDDYPVFEVAMAQASGGDAAPDAGDGVLFAGKLKADVSDAHLLINAHHQYLSVYVGEELVFETPQDIREGNTLGSALYYVPIGGAYSGKPLYIVSRSPFAVYAGMLRSVYIGAKADLWRYCLAVSMPYVGLMLICILGGLAFLVITVISAYNGIFQWQSLFLGIFSVLWGMFLISKIYIVYEFFSPATVSIIGNCLNQLYPFFISAYLYCRFQYVRKWARFGLAALAGIAFVVFALWSSGIPFLAITPYSTPVSQFLFAYVVVLGLVEACKGNRFMRRLLPFSLPLLLSWVLSMVQFYTNQFSTYPVDLMYNVSFFILIAFIWASSGRETFRKWEWQQNELEELRLHNQIITQTYQSILQSNEHIRELKHEMQHQLATLQLLLAMDTPAEAQAFLSRLVAWRGLQDQHYCDYPLVNEIVADAESQARRLHVQTTWNLDLPQNVEVNTNDLCSVLMNVLDNALRANEAMPEEKRYIRLSMHLSPDYLFLKCENAAAQKAKFFDGRYLTTKEDAENHGYGLRIIRSIVEDSGGLFDVDSGETHFTIRLALRLG